MWSTSTFADSAPSSIDPTASRRSDTWATPSPLTNRYRLMAWAAFAGINVFLMWLLPGEETVPFHFVWISLSLVYGFTYWRISWMVVALAAVVASTGAILLHHA